ncbi:PepSY domain-containing protein [Psychrobium sp. 1_MG-2023]|uniref:PepSY-associated TM helix domain-containing protein n=1 Tax=Psychrobium sp. 1_MG-2023 TaxID=3062624 RepID=UPI000C33E674|nr:PepSY-associated TM helix domain-containing protein [Psychrobium sp. 1_MG-2023]MDP2562695.1 PepSY-associated TM helix domain-containing protein [Psychrobium sp. 1_MG-2023]PKF54792.1 peptidase [Alteromonadales bacterium alter-6D02]
MRIRGDILRTYQSVHTWTGIVAGLVLFIGFYAGSLTVFKPEITQWATPTSEYLAPIEVEKYDALIEQVTAKHQKAADGFTLNFHQQASPLTWYESGGGRGLRLDDSLNHATLTQQDELVTQLATPNELGNLIDLLHRTAGIIGEVGHEDLGVIILGIAAVLYFLALVSGVIFLLPTLVKNFFALRSNKGASRFWLDSHNLVGIISLPFHLIIAWTVIVFSFHDVFYGGLGLAYGDKPLFERQAKAEVAYSVNNLHPVDKYIKEVNQLAQGYQIKSMEFSRLNSKAPQLGVQVTNPDVMKRGQDADYIMLHPYTLKVTYSSVFSQEHNSDPYGPVVKSFFALHFGNYGGEAGRWLYFVMGLLGAFLFYGGNLLWLEKRRQKQTTQSRSNRVMAALTVGICLGSVLALVSALLASKWFYLMQVQINQGYVYLYYAIFFAAIIFCFIKGAALGAIRIQQLLGTICMGIVITSVIAPLIPALGFMQHLAIGGFEIVALVFAMAFFYSAHKTAQRAYYGERNSIWALTPNTVKDVTPQQVTI